MKIKIFISVFILAVIFLIYCFFPIINYKGNNLPQRIFIKDRNWITITDKANLFWYKINREINFDSKFINDLILIEDKKYFSHFWIDIISKIWAFILNFQSWELISWWSTITEQYIKNTYFKNENRTYLQKLREAFLAIILSSFTDKDELLWKYLNSIYFWNNLYWIWTAIEIYFWKNNLNELSQEEIVLLISLIKNPWIQSLEEQNFRDYFNLVKNKLWYEFERKIFKLNKKQNLDTFPFVTKQIEDENPRIFKKSLKSLPYNLTHEKNHIVTSIDYELQKFSKDIINNTLEELKDKNVTNAAVFAIKPSTKEILIYQGSRDFYSDKIDWQVNVIKSSRQPGSTMKPFLYLQALEKWAWINDLLVDIESEYNSFKQWKTYISNNYSLKEYGLVRLKKALANSFNNSTVRLAKEIWLKEVYSFYKKYWFFLPETPEYYWYSLVLWNPNITLENLVFSYLKILPFKYQYNQKNWEVQNMWLYNKNKILLYEILSDPDNRDTSFWVNSVLNTSILQAVKTWTSSNFRDNYVVSYHPDFIIWVWVWNNDNSSMKWVTWITWAWYIWHQIIEKAIELWYIQEYEIKPIKWLENKKYCLDEKCFRTEYNIDKIEKEYFSKLSENNFSKNDLFEKLSKAEVNRLEELWFYLRWN